MRSSLFLLVWCWPLSTMLLCWPFRRLSWLVSPKPAACMDCWNQHRASVTVGPLCLYRHAHIIHTRISHTLMLSTAIVQLLHAQVLLIEVED